MDTETLAEIKAEIEAKRRERTEEVLRAMEEGAAYNAVTYEPEKHKNAPSEWHH